MKYMLALNRGAVWKDLWASWSGMFLVAVSLLCKSSMLCHTNKMDKSVYKEEVMRVDVAGRAAAVL